MTESNILKYQTFKTDKLIEYARNPRKNDFVVDRMVSCIKEFGFRIPIVTKSDGSVVDGHLRLKAARKLGLEEVPVVIADDLSEAQIKAFRLVANQSANWAEWNEEFLRLELLDLKEMDFDLDLTGFDMSEVDRRLIQANREIHDDDFEEDETNENESAITKQGCLWILGKHRLLCGDPTDQNAMKQLMNGKEADMIFTDAPHSDELFEETIKNMISCSKNGSIHYICADWKRMYEIISIGRKHYSEFKQLCFWKKDRAKPSEFYDNQHELIFIFKNGEEKHINHFGLGETGRYRTNVWRYSENLC
ncbi:MAG: ParB N-terminal domain-containing protein, partial [Alphaproteobacteria bacterium]|nr:ParB N-terminal domain-containing protein [Alphaproteobacteria bacterium]